MPVSVVDPYAEHFLGVQALIAQSPAFQSMTATASQSAAMADVYGRYIPPTARRPWAHVYHLDAKMKHGGFWSSVASIIIEREIPQALWEDYNGSEIDFRNVVGPILREIYDRSYDGGFMPLRSPIKILGQLRTDPAKELGPPYWGMMFQLDCAVD
jgi:hypothetical protein